jgi:hypothetical protein
MDEAVVFEKGERQYDFAISISVLDMGIMPGSNEWSHSFEPVGES